MRSRGHNLNGISSGVDILGERPRGPSRGLETAQAQE
jgi:hypothetical protein